MQFNKYIHTYIHTYIYINTYYTHTTYIYTYIYTLLDDSTLFFCLFSPKVDDQLVWLAKLNRGHCIESLGEQTSVDSKE